jgi:hypothetical protein
MTDLHCMQLMEAALLGLFFSLVAAVISVGRSVEPELFEPIAEEEKQ